MFCAFALQVLSTSMVSDRFQRWCSSQSIAEAWYLGSSPLFLDREGSFRRGRLFLLFLVLGGQRGIKILRLPGLDSSVGIHSASRVERACSGLRLIGISEGVAFKSSASEARGPTSQFYLSHRTPPTCSNIHENFFPPHHNFTKPPRTHTVLLSAIASTTN